MDNCLEEVGNFSVKLRSLLTVRLHPTTKTVSEQPPLIIISCQQLHFPISSESLHLSLFFCRYCLHLLVLLHSVPILSSFTSYCARIVAISPISKFHGSINIRLLYMPRTISTVTSIAVPTTHKQSETRNLFLSPTSTCQEQYTIKAYSTAPPPLTTKDTSIIHSHMCQRPRPRPRRHQRPFLPPVTTA